MSFLKRQSLVHQIALAASFVSLVIFAGLIIFTSHFTEGYALKKTEEELTHQVTSLVNMLELSHENAVARANNSLARIKGKLGTLRVGPDIVTVGAYQLPALRSGEVVINGNEGLLESLRNAADADPALLVRSGDEFVRAATLLKDKDGKSTQGTPLKGNSPEVQALLAGKPYTGVVKRNGKFYVSAIEPITDDKGKVVAAIAARVNIQAEMDRLMKTVSSIKSGDTGYAYIVAPGADTITSEFIAHPTVQGKNIGEINNPAMTSVVDQLLARKQGVLTYNWSRSPGAPATEPKMVVFQTVGSWNWIVATGSFIDEFTKDVRTLRNTLIGLCLGGALLMSGVLFWISRRQLAPLHVQLDAMQRIGAGDMTVRFPDCDVDSRNELDQMGRALQNTTAQVGALIREVMEASTAVRDAAHTLHVGASEVFDGTATQSEAAAGLAAAVEELSVSITHVSDSATTAHDITRQAQQHAEHGGTRVRQMTEGMNRIASEIDQASAAVNMLSERSARISNIGKIINDIADQTNLLALNAAIEAARAGETGRGFAVVADEVRKLAERTASSTREISVTVSEVQTEAERVVTMINGVTSEVQAGVRLAADSGSVLATIGDESTRTTQAVNDIADATREQSAASQEVARGIEHIATMAEQNKQATRQTQEQTRRLEELAAQLQAKVSHFRT